MYLDSELRRNYLNYAKSEGRSYASLVRQQAGMYLRHDDDEARDLAIRTEGDSLQAAGLNASKATVAYLEASLLARDLTRRGKKTSPEDVLREPPPLDTTGQANQSRPAERRIRAVIEIGGQKRRDGMRIAAAGLDVSRFEANPVVLFDHGRDRKRTTHPIGRADQVKLTAGSDGAGVLTALVRFGSDRFCRDLFDMVSDGMIGTFEARVMAKDWRRAGRQDTARDPDLETVVTRSELIEISLVALASDREAVALELARGRSIDPDLKHSFRTLKQTIEEEKRIVQNVR